MLLSRGCCRGAAEALQHRRGGAGAAEETPPGLPNPAPRGWRGRGARPGPGRRGWSQRQRGRWDRTGCTGPRRAGSAGPRATGAGRERSLPAASPPSGAAAGGQDGTSLLAARNVSVPPSSALRVQVFHIKGNLPSLVRRKSKKRSISFLASGEK